MDERFKTLAGMSDISIYQAKQRPTHVPCPFYSENDIAGSTIRVCADLHCGLTINQPDCSYQATNCRLKGKTTVFCETSERNATIILRMFHRVKPELLEDIPDIIS